VTGPAFTCNGERRPLDDAGSRLLIEVLREDLGLTGTKLGCGTGDCGACTVLLDGRPANACLVFAAECADAEVRTVEDVATTDPGAVLVDALERHDAVQCGICTPGFVVMATHLLAAQERPLERGDVEAALAGNLCRCTGYRPIVEAVVAASRALAGADGEDAA
jgi:aerobic-type carbon monoxide dehydrogenase small subunit (CoxS/CutS family)